MQIIRLYAQFLDYSIKVIRLGNANEFTSKTFDYYCVTIETDVEHLLPHVHTHNGLTLSLIKHLKVIARTLLLLSQLPISIWGHAILICMLRRQST